MSRRRPLVHAALAWALGVLIGRELGLGFPSPTLLLPLWLASLVLLLVAGGLLLARMPLWTGATMLLITGLGAISYHQSRLPFERLYPMAERLSTVEGTVVSYPALGPRKIAFVLRPDGLPGLLQIFHYRPGASRTVAYGDVLRLTADFRAPGRFDGFDYRGYLQTRGIWAVGSVWGGRQIDRVDAGRGHPLLQWGFQMRSGLFEIIDGHFSPREGGLMKGLLTGDRSQLAGQVEQPFRDAGVMHVLAVSGLHLGILLGLLWGALKRLRLSFTQAYLASFPPLIGYLTVVGFKVSLVRASIMFAFVAVGWVLAERGWILKRWVDPLQGLSAAAVVILAMSPSALFDVGFQLSFAATAGILVALQLLSPRLREWGERLRVRWRVKRSTIGMTLLKWGEGIALFLLISGAAQLSVAPFLAYHFHQSYLFALLANVAVVPLVTMVMWLGVFTLAAAALHLGLVAATLVAAEAWLLGRLIDVTQFFAALPGAHLGVDRELQIAILVVLPFLLSWTAIQMIWLLLPCWWIPFASRATPG